jgi:hypothetical protein
MRFTSANVFVCVVAAAAGFFMGHYFGIAGWLMGATLGFLLGKYCIE